LIIFRPFWQLIQLSKMEAETSSCSGKCGCAKCECGPGCMCGSAEGPGCDPCTDFMSKKKTPVNAAEGGGESCILKEKKESLPNDVWCIIFSHVDPKTLLTAVPQVCKQWRESCQELSDVALDFHWCLRQRPSNLHQALAGTWQKDSVKKAGFVTGICKIFPRASKLILGPNVLQQNINDDFLLAIAHGCYGFTVANFFKCDQITNVAVIAMAERCPQIETVDFSYCRNLTDVAVVALAKGCPNITSATFANCYDLTDKSLVSLAEGCPGLKTVTFPFVSNLTDKAVVALAKGCPHIAEVNFKFCVNLTDAAVDALVEHCSELTSENVELSCCAKLSGDAMQKFPSNDQLFMD